MALHRRDSAGRARTILTLGILGFGVFSSGLLQGGVSPKWVSLALVLYALPLMGQLLGLRAVGIYATWGGGFLVLQTILSMLPGVDRQRNFKTLVPHLDYRLDVVAGVPGVHGIQHVTTDGQGFRVLPPVDYQAPHGLRIFAIGGSTTEDLYLDDRETWTHLLQEHLTEGLNRPVEVINTGVSGLRAAHHLATLDHILQLHPAAVLFLVGVNDWNKHIRETYDPDAYRQPPPYLFPNTLLGQVIKRAYLALVTRFVFSRAPGAAGSRAYFNGGRIEDRGATLARRKGSLFRGDVRSVRIDTVASDYRKVLEAISTRCHQVRLLCIFVTQPHGYAPEVSDSYRSYFWMTPPEASYTLDLPSMIRIARAYNRFLLTFGDRNGHPVIDAAAAVKPGFEDFYDDVHLNTHGASQLSSFLAEQLEPILARRFPLPTGDTMGFAPN